MTLEEFKKELQNHDWFYAMSDDGRVYDRGSDNLSRLIGLAHTGGNEFKKAFAETEASMFTKARGFSNYKPRFKELLTKEEASG